MAEKKTTKKVEDTEVKEPKIEVAKDPFDEKVERMYPIVRGEDSHIYAEVNGRGYQVQRGIKVLVPKPIAEVIDNMVAMQFEEDQYIKKATEKAKK